MPQGSQRADQANVVHLAVVLQQQQLLGSEGAVADPDVRVPGEGEDVLDVKLQLVDLPPRQLLDEALEGPQLGHLAARAVVVNAATGVDGLIVDRAGRRLSAVGDEQVAQGGHGVVGPGVVGRDDVDAAGGDGDAVRLGGGQVDRPADSHRRRAHDAPLGPGGQAHRRQVVGQHAQRQHVFLPPAGEHRLGGPAETAAASGELLHGDQQFGVNALGHRGVLLK